ncbi:restriction endonuclease subunit S [uncultured Turicimonas sp.]|uniref:restriction endonuclease subunit S n=1 Tax=uncultured Turicimonas sp. TaxID=1918607 RepID=UPI002803B7CE|nr:restriction endonuclease subunit S [uncultured Turicimonas sp.]
MATKIPKIRFSRFDAAWEQCELGSLAEVTKLAGFEFTKYVNYSDNGTIIALRGLNIKEGLLDLKDVKYIDGSDLSKLARSKLFVDDIVFTYVGTVGEVALIPQNDRFYLAPNVARIRINKPLSSAFLACQLGSPFFYQRIIFPLIATSSQPALSMQNIRKFNLGLPQLEEQEKIASLFAQIGNVITLHQKKLKHFKNLKESLLQNMFPREGEIFPRLRFPEFTDAWEQRKLGELGETRSGIGFPEREQGGKEGLPFYKVSDMNLPGNESIMVKANNYVTADQIASNKWFPITKVPAILFAKVGAAVLLNRKRLCGTPFLLDNNTMSYSLDPSIWVTNFAHALFETLDLTQLVQVGALPSYGKKDVEAIHISIPTLPEQEKIGNLFYLLENAIALHQRKLAQLKKLKTCLFNNLFVN